MEELVDI